jgi:hypothetical protein
VIVVRTIARVLGVGGINLIVEIPQPLAHKGSAALWAGGVAALCPLRPKGRQMSKAVENVLSVLRAYGIEPCEPDVGVPNLPERGSGFQDSAQARTLVGAGCILTIFLPTGCLYRR